MEFFSALLAICAGNSPVTGEFLPQRPVMPSFDNFLDLRLYKRLNKQLRCRWFDTPSCSLWRHCYDLIVFNHTLQIQYGLSYNFGTENLGHPTNAATLLTETLNYCPSYPYVTLAHWGRDKRAAIFQTKFSHGFSWMKVYEFLLNLTEVCS